MDAGENDRLEPTPANPLCPICGAADWVSDPRWVHGLQTVNVATKTVVKTAGEPLIIPLDWYIFRVCRFLRLHSAAGDLVMRFPVD